MVAEEDDEQEKTGVSVETAGKVPKPRRRSVHGYSLNPR